MSLAPNQELRLIDDQHAVVICTDREHLRNGVLRITPSSSQLRSVARVLSWAPPE